MLYTMYQLLCLKLKMQNLANIHKICKHNSDFEASQCIINGNHFGARHLIAAAESSLRVRCPLMYQHSAS